MATTIVGLPRCLSNLQFSFWTICWTTEIAVSLTVKHGIHFRTSSTRKSIILLYCPLPTKSDQQHAYQLRWSSEIVGSAATTTGNTDTPRYFCSQGCCCFADLAHLKLVFDDSCTFAHVCLHKAKSTMSRPITLASKVKYYPPKLANLPSLGLSTQSFGQSSSWPQMPLLSRFSRRRGRPMSWHRPDCHLFPTHKKKKQTNKRKNSNVCVNWPQAGQVVDYFCLLLPTVLLTFSFRWCHIDLRNVRCGDGFSGSLENTSSKANGLASHEETTSNVPL